MLAFFATAWQAWLAWVHNRLTVKPQISSKRDTTITDQGIEIKMTIKNFGVGPALVIDRYFTVNGERFNPHEGYVVVSICEKILSGILKYKILRNGMFGGKAVLAPGEEIVIVQLFFPDAGPDEEKKILFSVPLIKRRIFICTINQVLTVGLTEMSMLRMVVMISEGLSLCRWRIICGIADLTLKFSFPEKFSMLRR